MRIVVYREIFSPLSETFVYDGLLEMERQGADCYALTNGRVNSDQRPYDKVRLVPPSQGFRWGRTNEWFFLNSERYRHKWPYPWLFYRRRLLDTLRHLQPDVIVAHFGTDGARIAPLARLLDIPLAVFFHGFDASRRYVLLTHRSVYNEMFDIADLVIGVSDYVCERICALGAEEAKVIRIRPGVDARQFAYSNPVDRFDGHEVKLLFVGRMTAKKSPLELLESFALARHSVGNGVNLTLTMVGDGELLSDVRRRVQEFDLDNFVSVVGALPHNEVRTQIQRAHICVQHSVTAPDGDEEGQPVSLIEASASGLPIVSTRHSGIPELVLDACTGFLVDEHDTSGMAERIVALSRQPRLWTTLGANGRKRVEREFSLHLETAKLLTALWNIRR